MACLLYSRDFSARILFARLASPRQAGDVNKATTAGGRSPKTSVWPLDTSKSNASEKMSRFLSSFWRPPAAGENGGDGEKKEGAGVAAAPTTGAASFVTMSNPQGGRGEPVMAVNQATVDDVLEPLGDEGAVNVVAIFGAARGGKSFLMNQLAGRDDIFKISNDKVRIALYYQYISVIVD